MKSFLKNIYESVPSYAESMSEIKGVLSVFNSNIDAVAKISPERFYQWLKTFGLKTVELTGDSKISTVADFLRGFITCFERGIAQEWLINSSETFEEIKETVGYDHLQMGGQGGIIGNVMSAAGVEKVFVHAASLPKEQASLFLHNDNLLSANQNGDAVPAYMAVRDHDIPLIHWILEFNKGDTITLEDRTIVCPKSNRFIATFDSLNFRLAIDPKFLSAVNRSSTPIEYCLLSGFQMLTEPLVDGTSSQVRIDESIEIVNQWKCAHPEMIVHFEFASTQDRTVRKMLWDSFSTMVDSIGVNEQELIDILDVTGKCELSKECHSGSVESLLKGLITLFQSSQTSRIQLHYYGQYVTIQRKGFKISPEQNLRGMAFAATAAASKAATGSIHTKDSLLAAHGTAISETATELFEMAHLFFVQSYKVESLQTTGIVVTDSFECTVIPTILVEKPVTLVGMGDTISSLSLTGAGKSAINYETVL